MIVDKLNIVRSFLDNAGKEGSALELDQYVFKINSFINVSDFRNDSSSREIFQKSRKKESGIDFGNIFKTACDELKQNQATHTKARVMTLN